MLVEFLLDSVILIDYLNDVDEAVEYLPQVEDTVSISVVTRAEVLTGFDAPSWARGRLWRRSASRARGEAARAPAAA